MSKYNSVTAACTVTEDIWKANNVIIICLLLFRLLAEMTSGVVLTGTGMWEKGKCNFSVKFMEFDNVKNEWHSGSKFKMWYLW